MSNDELLVMMREAAYAAPPGTYRHAKGGVYEVKGYCVREDDLVACVLYVGDAGVVFCRPVSQFVERFTRL